jgi:hypothetical protein
LLQFESSIVFDDLLILRKSLENHKKIGKMQTQLFFIPGENTATFLKLVYDFS